MSGLYTVEPVPRPHHRPPPAPAPLQVTEWNWRPLEDWEQEKVADGLARERAHDRAIVTGLEFT